MRLLLLTGLCALSLTAAAAGKSGGGGGNNVLNKIWPHPMVNLDFGSESDSITAPTSGITLDRGTHLHAGFAFNLLIADMMLGYDYALSKGKADYDFTDPVTAAHLAVTGTNVDSTRYGPYFGLRITPFRSLPVHPYIEGGYMMGTQQLSYQDAKTANPNSTAKFSETASYGGAYYEGGLEVSIGKILIGGGARFAKITTGKYSTLADQKLEYSISSGFGMIGFRY